LRARFSANFQTSPVAHTASCRTTTVSLPRGKVAGGVALNIHLI